MTAETAPVSPVDFDPVPLLAASLGLAPGAIAAVIALLDDGNTVPFIARYRKERTGGLDEVQIRAIEERRAYLVELETRRAAILASISEQGKLTSELEARVRGADSKAVLEDLYAPYRPRRKTRASVARDKGLAPLAERIAAQPADGDPNAEALAFVTGDVSSADDALAGARDIVAESIADTAEVRAFVRREYAEHGQLVSTVVPGRGDEPTKFEQYYQFGEAVRTIPSHRVLAIRRGEAEGVLRAQVVVDAVRVGAGIERLANLVEASPWAEQLRLTIADAFKRLLAPSVENDVRAELKQRSDGAAVDIFAGNLRNLMLAAPLGAASVIGVDPGLRTGCKCAAIDATGKFLGTVTVYITQGDAQLANAKEDFLAFVTKFRPRAIAIGNGTGGREAEAFVKKTLAEAGLARRARPPEVGQLTRAERASGAAPAEGEASDEAAGMRDGADAPFIVQVNEAGASVYSASDLAREEFPELDLTIRGAISIARRLQDPLAELVKIEPKSIGVGQYQHDVHQPLLGKKLGDVVEDCVNRVGVELNTASAQLLGYIAGIGPALAKKIVVHRDTHGAFAARSQLTDVGGLGPKTFEQAAGFLRIASATHPLDRSAVHPERYGVVEAMASDLGVDLGSLVGNAELVDKIDLSKYVAGDVGLPTLADIAAELKKPGRDPRAEFAPPSFRDDVTTMEDLKQGMVLEGIVTNVTAFGAFVDIGVHNDGLVHVSQLSDQFVKDPSEVVKVGQKLTVRVLEVDLQRKRIGLSARKGPPPRQDRGPQARGGQQGRGNHAGGPGGGPGGAPGEGPQGGGRRRGGRGRGGRGRGGEPGELPMISGDAAAQAGGDPSQIGANAPRHDQPRGDQARGDQARGDQGRGDQARGDQGRGDQGRGDQARGDQGRGDQARGDQGRGDRRQWRDRGPQGDSQAAGGGGGPSGPRDRGPGDRGPGDRGPRGPGDRGPGDRGPNDRGPRPDRGPRRDDRGFGPGPRGGGDRGGGPGPGQGGGRRDDRGPRRDDREPPQNWGVSGFVNNPFAKLSPKNTKS